MRQSHGCAILVKSHFPFACGLGCCDSSVFSTNFFVAVSPRQQIGTSLSGRRCPATGAAANACTVELDKSSITKEHAHWRSALEVCWQGTTAQKTPLSPAGLWVSRDKPSGHETACESSVKTTTTTTPLPSPLLPRGYDFLSFRPFWADFKSKLLTFELFYVNFKIFCWLRSSLGDFIVLYVNISVFSERKPSFSLFLHMKCNIFQTEGR